VDAGTTLIYSIDKNITFGKVPEPISNSINKEANRVFAIADIPVYNLNKAIIKRIPSSSIFVECFDICLPKENITLSVYERDMLSLYASFINSCGVDNIMEDYGLGLLRSRDSENIYGMYSEGYNSVLSGKAFSIRLSKGNNFNYVYDHANVIQRIIALLELSCHERSHYDKPNWSHTYAHSNEFQVNYNSIYHRAIRNLHAYESLYHHIHGNHFASPIDVLWIFFLIILIVLSWSWLIY
tara:strand:+ start:2608 stop:3327 length:720 start_codon:yes stop_codon:yes gene_type:complete